KLFPMLVEILHRSHAGIPDIFGNTYSPKRIVNVIGNRLDCSPVKILVRHTILVRRPVAQKHINIFVFQSLEDESRCPPQLFGVVADGLQYLGRDFGLDGHARPRWNTEPYGALDEPTGKRGGAG